MFRQDKQRGKPEKQKNSKRRRRKGMTLDDRPLLEPNAAGIDIGAREIFVAVPSDRDENPVRVFPTFTADLEEMAKWLVSCGITTVAMESTGVYWIPLYDILEQHGVTPISVNLMIDFCCGNFLRWGAWRHQMKVLQLRTGRFFARSCREGGRRWRAVRARFDVLAISPMPSPCCGFC
jgi:hypothetical protein